MPKNEPDVEIGQEATQAARSKVEDDLKGHAGVGGGWGTGAVTVVAEIV